MQFLAHHDLGTDLLPGLYSFPSLPCTATAAESWLLANFLLCSAGPAFFECVAQIFHSHVKGKLTVTESFNCHISSSQNGILLKSTGVRLSFNGHQHFKTS